ncbi:phosphate ABC transporter permease PstA [Halopenitus persicus]|uniref:Phosphate transport system permease protein PstA n=1 Tax=Halopenitus persicus TaxID=1048396 RepID=A0A1H3FH53_9EURY|nr:phosphate ABC transporter permease PstA [Halopenitus persicus]QHS16645.1 phosphate ABC transporter permease PstA [haloarchaeon 3A1-DGR]SDX90260.1 phosphate ABC transporter membrane protein 2, PhoT family [Halopenitus persicus]
MAGATRTPLIREDASRPEAVAGLAIAVAVALIAVGIASLFGLVGIDATLGGGSGMTAIGGVTTVTALGGLLVALGAAVIGLGVGSALGYVETEPSPNAGLVATVAFAGVWFVLGGLAASVAFDGVLAWLPAGAATGGAAFVTAAATREDVGSTLPAGAVAVVIGGTFLTGTIGPSWVWDLGFEQQASLTATFVVPAATIGCGLLAGWAAAKAYGGFGARGRRMGAYLLIYVNASAIIGVLFLLIAFTAVRGIPGLLTGATVAPGAGPTVSVLGVSVALPVSVPFVMNGVSLLNDFQGVLPAIVGTVWLVVGAVVFAVPLGVGAAVFLTEYAERGRLTQAVEIATNGLWSTPSIVFGLFGFTFLVPRFGGTKSLLSGMLTLGFMLLPLVLITSREALLAVPDEYRDASAALGVSKWHTIRSVVVPAALPGVVTGVILGVGRIAGETAPILLTMTGGTFVSGDRAADVIGGFAFTAQPPFVTNPELLRATTALPFQLYALITAGVGLGDNVSNPTEFQWATAFVLLLVVLSFYAVGIGARYYFRRRLRHE